MFTWEFPYPSQRMPLLAKNVVATSQPLAAQAGLQALARGGNAVDAALAAAITLTVVEPTANGIGSDAFAILWDGEKLVGLNASGRAPAGWTPERFQGRTAMPVHGWDAVTVPGCVSAWVALSQRYGKLPFPDLFQAAIRYARDGFMVSPITALSWARQAPNLKGFSEFSWTFLPKDRAPRAGERFYCPQQAETLEEIAASKGESFYRGKLAERIALASRSEDGAHTVEDFAAHRCDWVEPHLGRVPRLPPARDPAQRPGHRRPHGAGDPAPLRPRRAARGRRRQPAPADRGDEARLRRRLPLRLRPGHDGVRRGQRSSPTTTSRRARRRST